MTKTLAHRAPRPPIRKSDVRKASAPAGGAARSVPPAMRRSHVEDRPARDVSADVLGVLASFGMED